MIDINTQVEHGGKLRKILQLANLIFNPHH
jgi:hypothetical protein